MGRRRNTRQEEKPWVGGLRQRQILILALLLPAKELHIILAK